MEVDVPVLSEAGVTDLNIECIQAQVFGTTQYLQSSPEYYMKRLLASGLGSIYYMGKAFRNSELGRRHQPEFTMLEWYRSGWDEHQLINEVAEFLQCVGVDVSSPQIIPYEEIFQQVTGLNPHQADLSDIQVFASNLVGNDFSAESRSTCLDLILSIKVEPS
jgi:lysyl-tRNA synthetase class 2